MLKTLCLKRICSSFLFCSGSFIFAMDRPAIIPTTIEEADHNSLHKKGLAKEKEGNCDEAIRLYEKAAALGNVFSHFQLAHMYGPRGVKGKASNANELYYLRAALDCVFNKTAQCDQAYEKSFYKTEASCAYRLAQIYVMDSSFSDGLSRALEYYKKALVFDPTSNKARLGLAELMLRLDSENKETNEQARTLLTGITDEALREAQVLLGKLCLIDFDYKGAISSFSKAGENPEAQYQLGLVSESGQGLSAPDVTNALALYRAAAEKGHLEAIKKLSSFTDHPGAQCVLGRLNRLGIGMEINEKQALILFMKSCRGKCSEAFRELREMAKTNAEAEYCIAVIYEENIMEVFANREIPHIAIAILHYNNALISGHFQAYDALKKLGDAGKVQAIQCLLIFFSKRDDEWADEQRIYWTRKLRDITGPCQETVRSSEVLPTH